MLLDSVSFLGDWKTILKFYCVVDVLDCAQPCHFRVDPLQRFLYFLGIFFVLIACKYFSSSMQQFVQIVRTRSCALYFVFFPSSKRNPSFGLIFPSLSDRKEIPSKNSAAMDGRTLHSTWYVTFLHCIMCSTKLPFWRLFRFSHGPSYEVPDQDRVKITATLCTKTYTKIGTEHTVALGPRKLQKKKESYEQRFTAEEAPSKGWKPRPLGEGK